MKYSLTLCFAGFECRRSKSNKKIGIKLAKAKLSRHNFIMSRHNLNRNRRSYVATNLKLNSRLEVSSVMTFHNFVATQIRKIE